MNKPTLTLLSAIAIIGVITYWFTSQQVQSSSPSSSPSQGTASIAKQANEQEISSYRNPMNPVTTLSTPATDSVKVETINISEELATPNQILIDSESNNRESTAKLLETLETLKNNQTNTELELHKQSANKTDTAFSISTPETEDTMRITPNKNNSTMDVKK